MNRSALLLPLLVGLAACQSGAAPGSQRTDGFPAPDKQVVYDVAARTLQTQGFTVDRDASSDQSGHLETRWLESLQPFSMMGYRDRATVDIREVPGHRDYYVVETRVIRQRNKDQVQPGNPIAADWGEEERVEDMESLITGRIQHYFVPSDVSDKFRQRYGVPGTQSPRLENPALTEQEQRHPDRPR
jgi:hypothetical protein